MAIKISGTTVIDDSRTLLNVIGLKTINGNSILGSGNLLVGGNVTVRAYTTPATWTKPTGLKAVKVIVVGGGAATGGWGSYGGGGGGSAIGYLDASAIPGPVSVTIGNGGSYLPSATGALSAGNTSSFGPFFSATGGTGASSGTGGTGTGGLINISGEDGGLATAITYLQPPASTRSYGTTGKGGNSLLGFGGAAQSGSVGSPPGSYTAAALVGKGYGAGASGVGAFGGTGANGTSGIVVVEEYY